MGIRQLLSSLILQRHRLQAPPLPQWMPLHPIGGMSLLEKYPPGSVNESRGCVPLKESDGDHPGEEMERTLLHALLVYLPFLQVGLLFQSLFFTF